MSRFLHFIGLAFIKLSKVFSTNHSHIMVAKWFADKGDKTHRLNYFLSPEALVFDLGGYEGQWASDIYCKYKCKVFVFEPSKVFYDNIVNRFQPNNDFQIYQFGLSNANQTLKLFQQKDGSSIHISKEDGTFELIELQDANEFLNKQNITAIDLMKINIEGGEYDLLEHLIKTQWVHKIKNIQVQFHDFVDHAEERMKAIQTELSKTHELTYQYIFVWENWRLKDSK